MVGTFPTLPRWTDLRLRANFQVLKTAKATKLVTIVDTLVIYQAVNSVKILLLFDFTMVEAAGI